MSKKTIKPKRIWFFASFFYGLLFWVFLSITLFIFLIAIDANKGNEESSITMLIPPLILTIATIGIWFIRRTRVKNLALRLPIQPKDIHYTADEVKHYVGIKDTDSFYKEYYDMCAAYGKMAKSKLVQVVLSTEENTEARSSVDNYIKTALTKIEFKACPVMYLKTKVPTLIGCDRAIFYLYPHFVLRVRGKKDITAISYSQFNMQYAEGSYIIGGDEKVPRDAEITGKAYKYCNKDGSPDKRKADNPYEPVIKTANLIVEDFNIEYMLSNVSATETFFDRFMDFTDKVIEEESVKSVAQMMVDKRDELLTIIDGLENEQATIKEEKKEHKQIIEEDEKPHQEKVVDIENPFQELSNLIGLDNVKSEIKTLANLVQVQQARDKEGLKNATMSYHLVFNGNPGTGKTTIARIIAAIYRDLGILKKGHLVETDRSGLVAGYLGQTAIQTNAIIDKALDGVLFIDEAYSLSEDKDSYGKEAIATLLKRMEDDRDRLVVVLAGYTDKMQHFISTNPGLESRFNRYIDFPDYSEEELLQIFMKQIEKYEYKLTDEALSVVKETIHSSFSNKDEQFGNARFIRNMFERVLANQANRLAQEGELSSDKLRLITETDCKS